MKAKNVETGEELEFDNIEKDENAGEIKIEATQIKHTPMGTVVEPAKFSIGDKVKTVSDVDMNNVRIPEGLTLTVMGIMGDDMYSLVGPEGLIFRQNGAYLEKIKED